MPRLVDPQGNVVEIPDNAVATAISQGFRMETPEGQASRLAQDVKEDAYGGAAGKVVSFGAGALSGATLGLSDVALSGLGAGEDLQALREVNPYASTAGNVVGSLAPVLVPGGVLAKTPTGYLARLASEGTEAARAAGGIRAVAGTVAISGGEAAAQNAGMYLSDVALGDRDLTAEGMAGALGSGFAFGGLAGGAVLGIEKGTMAARRMFSRTTEGGERAAKDAASAFERAADETRTAYDDAYKIARSRYDEIQQMKRDALEMRARSSEEIARTRVDEERLGRAGLPEEAPVVSSPAGTHAPPAATEPLPSPTLPSDTAPPSNPKRTKQPKAFKIGDTEFAPVTPEAPAAARSTAPTAPLEDQLAEMASRVQGGESIQSLNSARTADILGPVVAAEEEKLAAALGPFEQRRAKVDEWVDRIKNPRKSVEATGGGAGQSPGIRSRRTQALDEDVFVEQSGGGIRTIGKKEHGLEDITPNSRALARSEGAFSRGSQLDEMYSDAVERAALAESRPEMEAALHEAAGLDSEIHAYVRATGKPEAIAVVDRIETVRKEAGRSAYDAAFARAEKRAMRETEATVPKRPGVDAEQEAAYQEALRGQGARGPVDAGFLSDAERTGRKMRGEMINAERAKKGLPALSDDELARVTASQARDLQYGSLREPTVLGDVDEAAKTLGDFEKAGADLVDAVGDAAPPKAKEHADGLRKAETDSERKVTDRTARAVDDAAEFGPQQRTPQERRADARQAKLEADATLARLKTEEIGARDAVKEARAKLKPAKGKRAPAPANANTPALEESQFGKIADIGAVLEAANTVGIPGLPKPSDLPVIGPLLGLYLKARALRAVAGRMTGRVAATGDAKAAALAAKTKERIARSVDRMLGLVERTAPAARSVAIRGGTPLLHALSKRLYDDGEPDAPDGASLQHLAAVRIREVRNANPSVILADVRKQMRDVTDPDLIAAAEKLRLAQFTYLSSKAPPQPPDNPFAPRQWMPSKAAAMGFAKRVQVVNDPASALDDLEAGQVTVEAAETLKAVFPKLYSMVQSRLLERAADLRAGIPFTTRRRMELLFNVPLDPLSDPGTIALLHKKTASEATPPPSPMQSPQPSVAAPVDLAALYTPAADRRAARR